MTINETQRFEMHLGLRNALGDDVAGALMEHLPPSGWADVARVRDIEHLRDSFDHRFSNLETKAEENFTRVDARLNAIVTGLWTAGTVFTGAFIGLFTLIVTKL